jgi:hypothetical protein
LQIESSTYDRAVTGATAGLTRGVIRTGTPARDESASVGFSREEDRENSGSPEKTNGQRVKLMGAAEALPGQGEADGDLRLSELLSTRSVLPPISSASEPRSDTPGGPVELPDDRMGTSASPAGGSSPDEAEEQADAGFETSESPGSKVAVSDGVSGAAGAGEEAKAARNGESDAAEKAEQTAGPSELSEDEKQRVEELQDRDREVRQHEQAHIAAGGQYVRGGASYQYENGPDGKRYAVGGEVSIDTSTASDDPQANIQKAQLVRRAALAPAKPSSQDRRVAAAASQMEAKARQELAESRREEMADAVGEPGEENDAQAVEGTDLLGSGETQDEEGEVELLGGDAPSEIANAASAELLAGEIQLSGATAPGGEEEEAGALGASGDLMRAGLDGASSAESSEKPRMVEGLAGLKPGEKIEKMEVVRIDDDEDDGEKIEPPPAPSGPPVSRLDYGPRPDPGQLLDVYR